MKKCLVELIGTFFLVLTIGLAAGVGHAGDLAPLAIGFSLMAMIYAGGHVSGAHFNPAATLAFWLRGRFPTAEIPGYLVAQVLGATLAALLCAVLDPDAVYPVATHDTLPLLLAEVLFTFALCWVILHTATAPALADNGFYGLAIAAVVIGGAYAVGPISSAVFNPAVAIALCVQGVLSWSILWIYAVAQLVGSALAAVAFRWVIEE